MAKSSDSSKSPKPSQAADVPTPPAQHIWLAGLGAMAKAQEQGTKAIEALVNDGLAFQRKSQAEAQQRLHEATERLSHIASDFGQQTSVRVDRLEHLFEDRVAKALHRLGMPTLQDMHLLNERIARLEAQLAQTQQPAATRQRKAKASEASSSKPAPPATADQRKRPVPKAATAKTTRRPAG
jgi:poly(hydroxyalkanoate) granule-associated protein